MSCSQCPHCQRQTKLAPFTLPPRPVPNGPGAAERNAAFYAAFAAAYERARTESNQPGKLLREANSWLTVHSVRDYYRKVRELGWLSGPGAGDGRSAPARAERPAPAPMVQPTPAPSGPPVLEAEPVAVTIGAGDSDDTLPPDDRPAPWCELPRWLEMQEARWLAEQRNAGRPVTARYYARWYAEFVAGRAEPFTVDDAAEVFAELVDRGVGRMEPDGFVLADRFRDAPRGKAPARGRPRRERKPFPAEYA